MPRSQSSQPDLLGSPLPACLSPAPPLLVCAATAAPPRPHRRLSTPEGHKALLNVLSAYALSDPEIGYTQASNLLAGRNSPHRVAGLPGDGAGPQQAFCAAARCAQPRPPSRPGLRRAPAVAPASLAPHVTPACPALPRPTCPQGMNFLAGVLLTWLPSEADAFAALSLLMRQRGLREM